MTRASALGMLRMNLTVLSSLLTIWLSMVKERGTSSASMGWSVIGVTRLIALAVGALGPSWESSLTSVRLSLVLASWLFWFSASSPGNVSREVPETGSRSNIRASRCTYLELENRFGSWLPRASSPSWGSFWWLWRVEVMSRLCLNDELGKNKRWWKEEKKCVGRNANGSENFSFVRLWCAGNASIRGDTVPHDVVGNASRYERRLIMVEKPL